MKWPRRRDRKLPSFSGRGTRLSTSGTVVASLREATERSAEVNTPRPLAERGDERRLPAPPVPSRSEATTLPPPVPLRNLALARTLQQITALVPARGMVMARKAPKTAVVAFKVEEELAEFLNKLPNKSAFIRKAIAAQLGMACPLCNGKGVGAARRPRPLRAAARQVQLRAAATAAATSCPCRATPATWPTDDRDRLEQFFHGGPLYCDGCYDKAPTCDDCGWHIAAERVAEHLPQGPPAIDRRRPLNAPRAREPAPSRCRTPTPTPLRARRRARRWTGCCTTSPPCPISPSAAPRRRAEMEALLREPPPETGRPLRRRAGRVRATRSRRYAFASTIRASSPSSRRADLPVDAGRLALRRHQLLRRRLARGGRPGPGRAGRPRLVQASSSATRRGARAC